MSTEPTKPAAVNPLAKFFRTPAIYVTLPSGGQYWPEGALELPENGEIPIFPLTNRDEITLRTPDALMNGQGVVDVIHSCVPAIKDAWQMPSIDVDSTLIAIRIASYGHSMEFDSKCHKCKAEHTYALDLRHMMSNIRCPDYEQLLDLEKVKIKFKPQNYLHTSHIGKVGFEIQKLQNNCLFILRKFYISIRKLLIFLVFLNNKRKNIFFKSSTTYFIFTTINQVTLFSSTLLI